MFDLEVKFSPVREGTMKLKNANLNQNQLPQFLREI
jgi:hypothetical protein